ncbi:DUF3226 domain-containing protein [Pedobacter sp. FW305-3-2-15-E-R2A2]|uniref:DUF3226 domain-containing protein n=1 Tax=Pedobacter sp. FW305-3-2-15-E-R2A2 TaxID=3140251 RepID=UPI00314071FF
MPVQIISVLCEGPHDVAFIERILKTIGFKSNESTKIGQFPPPFNSLLLNEASKTNIEQLNLTEMRRNLLPSNTLKKEDNYIFLYSLGGDSKADSRIRILQELRGFITEAEEISILPADTSISLVYFFDADDQGVDNRISYINREVKTALPEIENDPFEFNGDSHSISKLKLGTFIFTDNSNVTGKLEDILVPLMKQGNEVSFDAADKYLLTHHEDARLFPLKLNAHPTTSVITEARSVRLGDKKKFDPQKSLLGTVGQLQRSGKSNVVCISDSDYLTLDKIIASTKCQEIIIFFNAFII